MKNRKNKKGFTIVELVIVIGVIGILSAILIPTFSSLVKQAQDTKVKADLAGAYSMYAADAADGILDGTEKNTQPTALEFLAQDKVFLSKANQATNSKVKGYVFNKEWAANEVEWTVDTSENPVASTVKALVGATQYGEYYVWKLN